jgi:hypothetical protein
MTITISSTTKMVELNGVPARVWEGETESGIKCHAFITRIGVARDLDASQFEAELKEQRTPPPEIEAIPLRLILWVLLAASGY